MPKIIIFTIGHSTHTLDSFIKMLQNYGIQELVDIRTIPRSRHNPQFNSDTLEHALKKAHISYQLMKGLGGLRHAKKDSVNMGWQNSSFRGFADYMQTAEFKENLVKFIEKARHKQLVIMCAEAIPWRCHRSLIGDALLIRGIDVQDIFSATSSKPHELTPWAHVEGTTITYPSDKQENY